jgi:hypothetical protein
MSQPYTRAELIKQLHVAALPFIDPEAATRADDRSLYEVARAAIDDASDPADLLALVALSGIPVLRMVCDLTGDDPTDVVLAIGDSMAKLDYDTGEGTA